MVPQSGGRRALTGAKQTGHQSACMLSGLLGLDAAWKDGVAMVINEGQRDKGMEREGSDYLPIRLRATASRTPLRKLMDSGAEKRRPISRASLMTMGNGVDLKPSISPM